MRSDKNYAREDIWRAFFNESAESSDYDAFLPNLSSIECLHVCQIICNPTSTGTSSLLILPLKMHSRFSWEEFSGLLKDGMSFVRVVKCHGYDRYIREIIFAGWGKKFGRTQSFAKSSLVWEDLHVACFLNAFNSSPTEGENWAWQLPILSFSDWNGPGCLIQIYQ